MNLNITGHHVEVTPAIREYISSKLDRVIRHFDNVTSVGVILSVEKLRQKAEVTVHVRGKDIHCLLYTSPSPRDRTRSRMPSSA